MKLIPLTRNQFAMVDDEDFDRVMQFNWQFMSQGTKKYAVRRLPTKGGVKGGKQYLHHFIIGSVDCGLEVDHKDRNGLNCQRGNLRVATHQQNSRNRKHQSTSSFKYKGVKAYRRDPSRYYAVIYIDNKMKRIGGLYSTQEDAAQAYNWAALFYFGEFASFNERIPDGHVE